MEKAIAKKLMVRALAKSATLAALAQRAILITTVTLIAHIAHEEPTVAATENVQLSRTERVIAT